MLASVGAIAWGLAFGWGIAGRRTVRHVLRTSMAFAAATLIAAAEVAFFIGSLQTLSFVGAAAFSLWVHLAWREQLRKRFGPVDPTEEVA